MLGMNLCQLKSTKLITRLFFLREVLRWILVCTSFPRRYSLVDNFLLSKASIDIDPPKGTPPPAPGQLLEDVKMSEENGDVPMTEGGPNGHHVEPQSHPTKRSRSPSPVAQIPAASSSATVNSAVSYASPNEVSMQEDDGSVPPPAKRARTFSDLDQASVVHVSTIFSPYAVAGVLIWHPPTDSTHFPSFKVGDPTTRVGCFQFHQYHSHQRRNPRANPHDIWSRHHQCRPIPLYPIHRTHTEKVQRRRPIPSPCRPHRS